MSSVEQYPDTGYFLIADTSTTQLGSYTGLSGTLKTAHLRVYNRNSSAFTYTLKLEISTSATGPTLASSDVLAFDDVSLGQTSGHWLFDLTFSFDGYDLLSTETYYVRLITTGYARVANDTYLGVWCDWLEPVNAANSAAARIAFGVEQ